MKRVCVFCGSRPGLEPEYRQAARQLGVAMVERNLELVYGGASVGLMGELADSVLTAGGVAIGVVLEPMLGTKYAHPDVDLRIANTLGQRKITMADLADGFIVLPGGLGTMDEFFEVATWTSLGMSHKPYGLLNVSQYYNKLIEFLDHATSQQFVSEIQFIINHSPKKLLDDMLSHPITEATPSYQQLR